MRDGAQADAAAKPEKVPDSLCWPPRSAVFSSPTVETPEDGPETGGRLPWCAALAKGEGADPRKGAPGAQFTFTMWRKSGKCSHVRI